MIKKYNAKIRYEKIRDNNIKLIKEHLNIEDNLSCSICNTEDSEFGFFDFHHKDPSTKINSISYFMGHKNTKKLLDEIDKCEIVCPNCHRKHHINENKNNNILYEQKLKSINIFQKEK